MSALAGKTSAIGLAPENVWGQPPLTLVSGSNYALGIAYSNPERFFVIDPGDGMAAVATIVNPDNEIDGTIETTRTILERKDYRGTFDFKLDAENAFYPLLAIFGQDTGGIVWSSQVNTVGMYTHTFTPYKGAGSFTVEEILGDGTLGRLTTGCIAESLELTFGPVVLGKLQLYGRHQIPNTYFDVNANDVDFLFDNAYNAIPGNPAYPCMQSDATTRNLKCTATPVYVDVAQSSSGATPAGPGGNGPFGFGAITYGTQAGFSAAFIKIDGTAQPNAELIEGFTITFARKLYPQLVAGNQYDLGACTSGGWTCKGRLQLNFKSGDPSIEQAYMRHSTISLNFRLLGPPNGAGGKNWAAEFYIPNMKFTTGGPNIPDGPILAGGDFVARQDPSLGYTAQVILTNSVVNGSIYNGQTQSGGLGGCRVV